MITIGLLHSTIRGDEKLIVQAAIKRNIKIELVDIRNEIFDPESNRYNFSTALQRSVSTIKGTYATHYFESIGINVINSSKITQICEDKFYTSLQLYKHKVPTLRFAMVFTLKEALVQIEKMGGFPIVMKPPLGSWGRLLTKINDEDCLETIIEHKDILGSPQQKALYIQEYVNKPGRDIRSFVVDGKAICAIYRSSTHWITNTARGGFAENCPLTKEIVSLSKKASDAIGGGILAMDIIETPDGMKINEINHTMEFKNSEAPTGVSISGAIIDYCIKKNKHD